MEAEYEPHHPKTVHPHASAGRHRADHVAHGMEGGRGHLEGQQLSQLQQVCLLGLAA
jgi:hypothetical protein